MPHDYRTYLACLARIQVPATLRVKVDLSGIVQQTLYEAARDHEADFATWPVVQQKTWLRRILANNLKDALRLVTAGKRAWHREQSLDAALDASSAALTNLLAHDTLTPSAHAMRAEDFETLARVLAELPESQRQAIEAIHLQGQPLAEVAEAMGRSKGAVAALLCRALKNLRERLKEETTCQLSAV